jgi:hypothetical protein
MRRIVFISFSEGVIGFVAFAVARFVVRNFPTGFPVVRLHIHPLMIEDVVPGNI